MALLKPSCEVLFIMKKDVYLGNQNGVSCKNTKWVYIFFIVLVLDMKPL